MADEYSRQSHRHHSRRRHSQRVHHGGPLPLGGGPFYGGGGPFYGGGPGGGGAFFGAPHGGGALPYVGPYAPSFYFTPPPPPPQPFGYGLQQGGFGFVGPQYVSQGSGFGVTTSEPSSSFVVPPPSSSSKYATASPKYGVLEIGVDVVATTPFEGQAPGTSGLRKRVKVFEGGYYLHNFVQSIFDSLPKDEVVGSTLVVGGDGRYYNDTALQLILSMAAANGVAEVIVGEKGILSTPAVSAIIRAKKAYGGIILTASHNPGGPDYDFGIKWNCSNGGPAPEAVTAAITEKTKTISSFFITNMPKVNLALVGTRAYSVTDTAPGDIDDGEDDFVNLRKTERTFKVTVIDSADIYVALMKSIFDFEALARLLQRSDFKMRFDAMNAVTGPYATRIFEEELKAPKGTVVRSTPLPDFGHCHPDPNLTYAPELVEALYSGEFAFGAASDGDGDRNMILGREFFVSPCDSLAVIADHAHLIPYFKETGVRGLARSMPTACAVDRVAAAKGYAVYEVPTGWKFFGNLMDAGQLSICGEESFGTGSDHVREKDGIWAVLAWLTILAARNETTEIGKFEGVDVIVRQHWKTYGRNIFTRYDYEDVPVEAGKAVINGVIASFPTLKGKKFGEYTVAACDEFRYVDPIDKSVSERQGIRILFECGSRIVLRSSGTSSSGATLRLYLERYDPNPEGLPLKASEALGSFVDVALEISGIPRLTGRTAPTVET